MKHLFRYCLYGLVAIAAFFKGMPSTLAQSIPLIQYKKAEGLPSNFVYAAVSDRKGYLWLGTDKGLCRFNGRTFKTYTTRDGLPDNEVFSCKEDLYGRLWVMNFKGTLCYLKDGVFHTAANTPWMRKIDGKMAFFTSLIHSDSTIIMIPYPSVLFVTIKDTVTRVYDIRGSAWLAGLSTLHWPISTIRRIGPGVFRIYNNTGYCDIDSSCVPYNIRSSRYNYNVMRRSGEFYLVNEEGLRDRNEKLINTSVHIPYEIGAMPYSLLMLNKDQILSGRPTGLFLNDQNLLPKEQVITFLERDINGNIWAASRGNGLYRISRFFNHMLVLPDAFAETVIYARNIDSTLYFVNNIGEVYSLISGKTKKITKLNKGTNAELLGTYLHISKRHDLMHLDKIRGNFLIQGLNTTKPLQRSISHTRLDSARTSKELIEDQGSLYLISIVDVQKLDPAEIIKTGTIRTEFLINGGLNSTKRIHASTIDPETHHLWLSRVDGVYRMVDGKAEQQPQFRSLVFRQFGFYGKYLVGITDNSKLLIGNNIDKDIQWDSTQKDDCVWERVYPIDRNHALISTNNYYRVLTLLPPAASGAPRYTLHTVEDPFLPQQAEYVITDTAYTTFFKEHKITRIETRLLFEPAPPPIPVFTSFRSAKKFYPVHNSITIPYKESQNINIIFDNISFTGSDITCEYAITKNGREEWLPITGNEINLNTPGFGDYTIKIRSKTLSSGYSKPAVLQLRVLRPYWATWWFIALGILALIALIWGAVYLITWRRLRKKQKEHEADMKYQQSEYKALNALMNPHFIFNSLNNIQGLINKDEKRIANEYLVIFSDLVRQNMHNVSRGFISLQQELNLVENYLTLEKLRFKELINYELQIDDEVDTEDIQIPPLMIQPLVENAVKHGLLPKQSTDSMVRILVYERDNRLYIEIIDNGIGITQSLQSKNRLYESYGLSNLKKRTEHLKKIQQREIDISVTELNEGERVTGTKAVIAMGLGGD